jgi:hypothetical protein
MKRNILIFLILFIFMFPLISSAVQVTLDLDKLSGDEAAAVLNAKKKADNPELKIPEPDQIEKYAKWGKEIGIALGEVCKTLNVEVNSFVKTPVGTAVAGLIIYHYFGKDMIKLILCILFSFTFAIATTISFYWCFSKKKVVSKQEGKVKEYSYIQRYTFKSDDARTTCAWVHLGAYCISILVFLSAI